MPNVPASRATSGFACGSTRPTKHQYPYPVWHYFAGRCAGGRATLPSRWAGLSPAELLGESNAMNVDPQTYAALAGLVAVLVVTVGLFGYLYTRMK